MANVKTKSPQKKASGNVKKHVVKKSPKKLMAFNKYSIYFQTLSILCAIAALTLNVCDCISISVMLDLFGVAVILLAFSLFPKKD